MTKKKTKTKTISAIITSLGCFSTPMAFTYTAALNTPSSPLITSQSNYHFWSDQISFNMVMVIVVSYDHNKSGQSSWWSFIMLIITPNTYWYGDHRGSWLSSLLITSQSNYHGDHSWCWWSYQISPNMVIIMDHDHQHNES